MNDLRADHQRGFTLAELVTVVAIIGILAAMVVPTAKFGFKRSKEVELRHRLEKITDAIDHYHDLRVKNMIKDPGDVTQGEYPKSLDELVEGVDTLDGKHIRFLRERDLIDPMTGRKEWRTLSTTDDLDATMTDGNNVFDVHSTSNEMSLDGKTRYSQW